LGYTVTGVDFNPQAVQTARERYGLEDVYCGTLEEFVRDRSPVAFDVVTAFEVLEHVEAPKGFLARIGRLVRPGGFLALSVPYRDRWPRLRSVEQWDIPPHHLSRWSKKALTTALEAAGFAIVDLRTGWMPGEEIILHYVRFGTIEWLFRRATRREVSSTRKQQLVAAASWLMRVKRAGVRLVGAPLNLVLRMAGATGLDMYVLASKQ
jgi:SAM-dependent methyltransferase